MFNKGRVAWIKLLAELGEVETPANQPSRIPTSNSEAEL
jgi:hypothetical protein